MKSYSTLVNELLDDEEDLLLRLCPAEPGHAESIRSIREATDEELTGGAVMANADYPRLIRAGLFYAHDALGESHRIVQEMSSAPASYWHGMMHRREGDFDNARYWFRRTGRLALFPEMHAEAARISPLMARQLDWDPYALVGQCEQARFGGDVAQKELVALQRIEFWVMFNHLWRGAFT
ncbi:MAG TPA: hypothetical protein VHY22_14230 [Chthoniobacteraceae bacterium]|jgi:hypothetical protein|nr:hypothetical protein [Chthoniobacteraceae bacterium]